MSAIFHAGISGARGRMGRAVSTVLDAREDVVVAARFDRGETPDLSLCDVIIDFSTPDASVELALTIDLRDFGAASAAIDCSQPEACALVGDEPGATFGLIHDWLLEHTPLLRQRARLGLGQVDVRASTRSPFLSAGMTAALPLRSTTRTRGGGVASPGDQVSGTAMASPSSISITRSTVTLGSPPIS